MIVRKYDKKEDLLRILAKIITDGCKNPNEVSSAMVNLDCVLLIETITVGNQDDELQYISKVKNKAFSIINSSVTEISKKSGMGSYFLIQFDDPTHIMVFNAYMNMD